MAIEVKDFLDSVGVYTSGNGMSEFAIACTMCGIQRKDVSERFGLSNSEVSLLWSKTKAEPNPHIWLEISSIWSRIKSGDMYASDSESMVRSMGVLDRMETIIQTGEI